MLTGWSANVRERLVGGSANEMGWLQWAAFGLRIICVFQWSSLAISSGVEGALVRAGEVGEAQYGGSWRTWRAR